MLLNVKSLCLVLRKRRAEAAKARKAKILAQVKFFIIWVSPLNVEASLFFFYGYILFLNSEHLHNLPLPSHPYLLFDPYHPQHQPHLKVCWTYFYLSIQSFNLSI